MKRGGASLYSEPAQSFMGLWQMLTHWRPLSVKTTNHNNNVSIKIYFLKINQMYLLLYDTI